MICSPSVSLTLTRGSISALGGVCRLFGRPSPPTHNLVAMSILKVEPLTTARALRGPFDSRRPATMEGVEVGSLVRVPFGPRRLLGVVVELADSSELAPERLPAAVAALPKGRPARGGEVAR